jgi:steroid 5-alpha reductase family enzyme
MRTGLYRFCQFPNYFAEISCWWVMFLWAGLPRVLPEHPYIVISPIFTSILLRYVSGVANLAASQQERYGSQQDYQEYVARTPVLLPFMKPFLARRQVPTPLMRPSPSNDSRQESASENTK